MMGTAVPIEVVLVEDNPGDARLVREGLKGWTLPTRMRIARDGEEALPLLRGEGPHAYDPRPDLVILDLNLPRKDGRDLLNELQADPTLRTLPVVILTSSTTDQEVLRRRGLRIDLYIVKPVRLDDFLAAVRSIEEFWQRAVGA